MFLLFIKRHSNKIFLLFFLALTLLGIFSFKLYGLWNSKGYTLLDTVYLTLQLYSFKWGDLNGRIPFTLHVVRILCPSASVSGIFLGFKRPIENAFEDIFSWYTKRRIKFYDNHIIICGLSKRAELLTTDIINQKKRDIEETGRTNIGEVVILESNPNNDNLSNYIYKGIKVIIGSAMDEQTLLNAGILKAKCFIAMTEKDEKNLEIAKKITDVFKKYYAEHQVAVKKQLKVIIHLEDFFYLQAFKDNHEVRIPDKNNSNSAIDFHSINVFQKAAQKAINKYSPDKFIEDLRRSPSADQAEILIMGLSQIGENILIQATYMYHFLNDKKLKIFIIDTDVTQKLNKIKHFVPALESIVQIVAIEQTEFLQNYPGYNIDNVSVNFVCKNTDGENVFYAKKLKQIFYKLKHNTEHPKVVVLLPKDTKILSLLDTIEADSENKFANIDFYNLYEDICTKKEMIDDIDEIDVLAKSIHYANISKKCSTATQEFVEQEWEGLPHGKKESHRFSARHLIFKLRFLGAEMIDKEHERVVSGTRFKLEHVSPENLNLIADAEHRRWKAEKLINGFEAYNCSDVNKQHHLEDLKLHNDLTEEAWAKKDDLSKRKDLAMIAKVIDMAEVLGKVVVTI